MTSSYPRSVYVTRRIPLWIRPKSEVNFSVQIKRSSTKELEHIPLPTTMSVLQRL